MTVREPDDAFDSPDFGKRRVKAKINNKTTTVLVKAATFEEALQWLRRGSAIRRRAWHNASKLILVGTDVFIMLPGNDPTAAKNMGTAYTRPPQRWEPYPGDFMASDWMKA